MIINNLPKRIFKTLGMETDDRFKSWVKFVDSVNTKETTGYAFQGEFIKEGTIEITRDKPAVLLAAAVTGSRRNPTTTYRVAVLYPDGTIMDQGIGTTDDTKGWALRLRQPIHDLLSMLLKMKTQSQFVDLKLGEIVETPPPTLTLSEEMVDLLKTIQDRMSDLTNEQITNEQIMVFALSRLEVATRPKDHS